LGRKFCDNNGQLPQGIITTSGTVAVSGVPNVTVNNNIPTTETRQAKGNNSATEDEGYALERGTSSS
jgi:hypothetical protein